MTDPRIIAGLALSAFGLAACDAGSGGDMRAAASMPGVQEQACLAAVSNEANSGEVSVLNSDFPEANTVVMIGVGADAAPWRCLVSTDGIVAEVYFAGSEGFL